MNEFLIEKVRKHVKNIFVTNHNSKLTFHDFDHTREVTEKCALIAKGSGLSDADTELLILAASFHDTGYLFQTNDHETTSAKMATEFLLAEGYSLEKITVVTDCIMATRMNYVPVNMMEKIIRDADLAHLGGSDYYKQSKLLRLEQVNLGNKEVTNQEWLNAEINFLKNHNYYTEFAQQEFAEQKADNIKKLKKKLRKLEEDGIPELMNPHVKEKGTPKEKLLSPEQEVKNRELKEAKEREKLEKEKEKKAAAAYRGYDNMFRLTSSNHMRLSAIADRKANIMLSLSAVIVSISLTKFLPSIQDDNTKHSVLVPLAILLISCLVTIVFATLATRPKIHRANYNRDDIDSKTANLFFFGNFANMRYDDFDYGMKMVKNDPEYLHNSMVNDFYFLGKALGKKFRNLQICYNVFMYGIIVAVVSFIVIYFFSL